MAASGRMGLALEALREMLAGSSAFQAFCGVGDAAAARAHLYYEGLPPAADGDTHTLAELDARRPFALLWTDPAGGFVLRRVATGDTYAQSGRLVAAFERGVAAEDAADPSAIDESFSNELDAILADLLAASSGAGALQIAGVELLDRMRSHPDQQPGEGDYVMAMLAISYDEGGGA